MGELREALWSLAFDGEPDERSTLGDIFEVAMKSARNRTKDVLERRLRVSRDGLPEGFEEWFSFPWFRIYTLNVDDLDEVLNQSGSLPRRLRVVSAISDGVPPQASADELMSVHLNGRLDEYPDVTFSQRQYGERAAVPDLWYQQLLRDLLARPVLFVGTELEEPPLWQHLQYRGPRGEGRERRPGSYLVSPDLPRAKQAMLREYNVDWVAVGQEAFLADILRPMADERARGLAVFQRASRHRPGAALLPRVSDLRTDPAADLREFVMGREPVWADLGDGGYAVEREFEAELGSLIAEQEPRVVLITGTAGSGKSATLMRLALTLQAEGSDARYLSLDHEVPFSQIRSAVGTERPDLLLIDDVDLFASFTSRAIKDLIEQNKQLVVIVAVRSSRAEQLRLAEELGDSHLEFAVPHLGDSDIDLLLDALDRANRLGQLKGKSSEQRIEAMRRQASRQLLVAMIQVTSGERFEEKIDSECRDLSPDASLLYSVVAVATQLRHGVTRHEVLLAAGEATNEAVNRLQTLIDRHLLVESDGLIRVRHRVIAERAIDYFRREGLLGEAIRGLMFAMAASTGPETRRTRPRSLLVRLLSHDWLGRSLLNETGAVRRAYDGVEQLLSWDYHYWLQRGSFEVEANDLAAAQNFLEQARSLGPDDYRVQTEWAYMVLKRAVANASEPEAERHANDAFEELEDAIVRRGDTDPYPFHILGSQGLEWVRASPLGREEKLELVSRIRRQVTDGRRRHPADSHLQVLDEQLENLYLKIGAVQELGDGPTR